MDLTILVNHGNNTGKVQVRKCATSISFLAPAPHKYFK